MKIPFYTLVASAMLLTVSASFAQEAAVVASPVSVVPHLIKFSGSLPGAPNAGTVDVKFSLYAAQTGGDPLWSENQQVSLDATGKYSVLLGSVSALPGGAFAQGQARWIGVTLSGEQESARIVVAATAYSLKASDSETLGGHPATDFTLKNAQPTGGTDITQITVGDGVTGGGTGPTVTLGLSSSYLETLGNGIYPQLHGTNTLSGKNSYTAGDLLLGSAPVLATTSVLGSSPVTTTISGNTLKIGLSDSALLTLGNGVYAQLGAANTFTKAQIFESAVTFASGQTFSGTVSLGANNTFTGSDTFSKAITFASGQTFPGTGTGNGTITAITTASPLAGSGTSGSVALSLNTSSLETTLSLLYPQLTATNTFAGSNTFSKAITFASGQTFPGTLAASGNNTFTGVETINGSETITGDVPSGSGNTAQLLVTNNDPTGNGVYATAANGAIVGVVSATTGVAVLGLGGLYGVEGATLNSGGTAIYGTASGAGSYGIYGNADVGVYGTSTTNNGVDGYTTSKGDSGVFGEATNGNGVYGKTTSATGTGTFGGNSNSTGTGDGVRGSTASQTGYAVHAISVSPSHTGSVDVVGIGAALWADTNQSNQSGSVSYGALLGTTDNNNAAVFLNASNGSSTLFLNNAGSGGMTNSEHAAPMTLTATGSGGACGMNTNGDVTCSGRLQTAVPLADKKTQVEVYAVQSSENWFEDFGSGQLFNGSAKVAIDSKFAQIVNTGVAYHVFLTPKGNCKGLFVTNEGVNGFEVRELGDGGSSVEFDYRIVAKRNGHEAERLADATAEMHTMTARRDQIAAAATNPHPAPLPPEQKEFSGPRFIPAPHISLPQRATMPRSSLVPPERSGAGHTDLKASPN